MSYAQSLKHWEQSQKISNLGESASVTNVKHEQLDSYRVVYFATHALVAGEVEKFAKAKG